MPIHDSLQTNLETPDRSNRDARLNVRLASAQAQLIKQAADSQDKSITDFVISSASAAAEQVLADRRWFRMSAEAWSSYEALLDRPAIYKPRLSELLRDETAFVD